MDFDEAVQGLKKRENYIHLFIQNWRFGGFFCSSLGFWKVSEGNRTWHSSLSPLSVAVTVIYNITLSAEFSVVIMKYCIEYRDRALNIEAALLPKGALS